MTTAIDESIPDFGLAPHANHGAELVQYSGCGEAPIEIRDHDTGGVVVDPTVYPSSLTSYNIRNVSRFSLWVQFTLGNLTNIQLIFVFPAAYDSVFFYAMTLPIYTAASRVVGISKANHIYNYYTLTASANIIIPIINPGAEWMRIILLEAHAVDTDNSLLGLHYSRSYLSHDIGHGIPGA